MVVASTEHLTYSQAKMSGRERILAALRRQPVDRLPFAPLIDTYTMLDWPEPFQDAILRAVTEGYWQGMLAAVRELPVDVMLRHVPVTSDPRISAANLEAYGHFKPPVIASARRDGALLMETLETPVGTLTGTWAFTGSVGWIPHPIKHVVNNYEELKIFLYAVEHLDDEPPAAAYEDFLAADYAAGDLGIATTTILETPLMFLTENLWGLENTSYLLHDYPAEVEAIFDRLHAVRMRHIERFAESPAQVVISYENTSSTLISPRQFRRYCLPCLNDVAARLHAAGKIHLVHMCGKLRAFVGDFERAEFDGFVDITPHPTGDLPLDEAVSAIPNRVWKGGIDPTTYINPDSMAVEAEITRLIERIKPYPGVLLGSADTTPRGTLLDNITLISRLVNTVGSFA